MAPPELPGFVFVDVLGSGGFADVYLYEQQLPRRRVAVKVLLPDRMTSGSAEEFTAEANVMAMLSTHPAIVTIYQAGVARDRRPYLVMEYCPKPNLQVRYRREPFSVAESLRVGVQVAAAVETAHRAGVLHRDIKPANILVTEYNRPALTDFGIATTTGASEGAGLSIPWSPPESFADVPQSGPWSDVYALGATVYTLLAGRSPFELPGRRNTGADIIDRIESTPLAPLDRPDAPDSLFRTLERAMAKAPADRYESALAFARALQTVQIELSHSVTPIDILDDAIVEDVEDDDDAEGLTRVRGVVSINPETAPAAGMTRPSTSAAGPDVASMVSGVPAFDAADTVRRGDPAPNAEFAETLMRTPPRGRAAAAPAPALPPPAIAQTAQTAPATFAAPPASTAAAAPPPAEVFAAPPAAASPTQPAQGPRPRRAVWWTLAASAVLVVVAVVVGVSLPGLLGSTPRSSPQPEETIVRPQDPGAAIVAPPADLAGAVVDGQVTFTWTNPDPHEGDRYVWGVVTRADAEPDLDSVDAPTVTVPADPSGTTCVEVLVRRANGGSSEPARSCAP
nr:serine/threonine-protein kinase [Microbacterium ulmi]